MSRRLCELLAEPWPELEIIAECRDGLAAPEVLTSRHHDIAFRFIPPVNTFAMIARLSSIAPPPSWEVWTTLLISLVTAMLVVWFAAKVFKVALLMHGRPPTFGTLLRWARMA